VENEKQMVELQVEAVKQQDNEEDVKNNVD